MPETSSSTSSSDARGDVRRVLMRVVVPYLLVLAGACVGLNWGVEQTLIYSSTVAGGYKVHRILHALTPGERPIIGSSRAKCCYVPDSLGPGAFNYGLNGTDYDVAEFFMQQALRVDSRQPLVVNVDYDWWSPAIGDRANYIADAGAPAVRALLGPAYRPVYRVPLLRHYGMFDTYVSDFLKNRVSVTEEVDQGAGLLLGTLSPARFQRLVELARAGALVYPIRTDSVRLGRLQALIDAHPGRLFLFVVAPYHPAYLDGLQGLGDARRWLADLEARPNVRVLNYDGLAFPDSLFFDLKHLNHRGARVFSGRLRQDIDRLLADRP